MSGGARPGMLAGVRVAVTRVRDRSAELSRGLAALGAEVLEAPLIAIAPPAHSGPLDEAVRRVGGYDWVVLTSVAGAEQFGAALERVGGSAGELGGVRVACIGPATAEAARAVGLYPELVAEEAVAESLLEGLVRELVARRGVGEGGGERVLLPVAEGARTVLERGLGELGVVVDRVTAYRTVRDGEGVAVLLGALEAGELDVVTFASPSAVEQLAVGAGVELPVLLDGVVVAAIGPITSAAVRQRGLEVQVEAAEHTAGGMLRALVEYYDKNSVRRP